MAVEKVSIAEFQDTHKGVGRSGGGACRGIVAPEF